MLAIDSWLATCCAATQSDEFTSETEEGVVVVGTQPFIRNGIMQRWANYGPRAACGPQGSHTYIDSTYVESMLK